VLSKLKQSISPPNIDCLSHRQIRLYAFRALASFHLLHPPSSPRSNLVPRDLGADGASTGKS
jgi:hypothetical protein